MDRHQEAPPPDPTPVGSVRQAAGKRPGAARSPIDDALMVLPKTSYKRCKFA
jgi:hypothetical protein